MSVNEKDTEKVATKYDLKRQKRLDEQTKEKIALTLWKIAGILLLLGIIAWIASYPVKKIMAVHKTVFYANGEAVKQVEFDYYYNVVKDNYIDTYGTYLSYYGMDKNTDPSTVAYSGSLTFKDYFEKSTVQQIQQNKGLEARMEADGFTYDATADYEDYMSSLTALAKADGSSIEDYIKSTFGQYATESRLKPIVMKGFELSAYYEHVYDEKAPTDEQIDSYYAENVDTYDSVDYYLTTINAELPTEPTELADEGAAVAEDGTYTPSDAEKEAAMADALVLAEAAEDVVFTEGDEHINERKTSVEYYIRSWMFDAERKKGDTTVIEDSYDSVYYVVGFTSRYKDETPTANIRLAVASGDSVDTFNNAWATMDGTEESFIEFVNQYSQASEDGGLYENYHPTSTTDSEMNTWILSSERKTGDVETFLIGDSYTYMVYYIGQGVPVWKLDVMDAVHDQVMSDYLAEVEASVVVTDPKKNLNYLVVEEQEAAAAAAEEAAAESTDDTAGTDSETTEDTASTEE